MADCLFEILCRAEILSIAEQADWKLDATRELRDKGDGAVGRSVVANYQLIGQVRLQRDAFELLPQVSRTVIGAHGHGCFHTHTVPASMNLGADLSAPPDKGFARLLYTATMDDPIG
jgi:hypothetical protein